MKTARKSEKSSDKSLDLDHLALTLVQAAHAGGAVLQKYFKKTNLLQVNEKKDAGLVTQADLQSEETILKVLKKNYKYFEILAEESAPLSKRTPHTPNRDLNPRFVIDPLDGTTNFVHAFPMFCVSIGAEIQGEVKVGVIYHPILNDTYVAIAGKGAWLNKKHRLKVSKTKTLRDSLLTTGFTYRKKETKAGAPSLLHQEMEAFERLSGIARAIRRPGSAALDLAYVSRGVFDGFWERKLSPWDVAAGSLLVTEAGGKVTDFSNNAFSIELQEILASNGPLHSSLQKSIAPESCPLPLK